MSGKQKIGFIGGGNMASAIIAGLLDSQRLTSEQIRCGEPNAERGAALSSRLGIQLTQDNPELVTWADRIVVAVKPQVLDSVLKDCAAAFTQDMSLISVCAGVPLSRFEMAVPDGVRLVRAMPNTPALVGEGATAIAQGPNATAADMTFARELFESVGSCVEVEEHYLDAVTGLSGSGPAYVMLVIEGLADGGVRAGLPRPIARQLAVQTVLGAAALVKATGEHSAALKDQVTSPGGTTIEGVYALEKAGVRHAMIDAVCRATERSKELGKG